MFRHKMAWWGLFIVMLFTVWFGGWFVLAGFADGKIEKATDKLKQDGVEIACDNQAIKGFPFRMGVRCDRLDVTVAKGDVRIESGAFRTTSVLYDPAKIIAELDGPLKVSAGEKKVSANWDLMRLFVDGEVSGKFELISLNYENLSAAIEASKLNVAKGAVHIRPTPDALQSLDIATNAVDLSAEPSDKLKIPKATLTSDLTVEDGFRRLILEKQSLKEFLQNGVNIKLRSLVLETAEGGKIALSGPLELQPDGKLSGIVRLGMAKPKAVGKWAAQINPEIRQVIAFAEQAMEGMGVASKFGGQEMRSIEIRIDDGTVRLGFIKIAKIPPLKGF